MLHLWVTDLFDLRSKRDNALMKDPICVSYVESHPDLREEYKSMVEKQGEIEDLNFHRFKYLADVYLVRELGLGKGALSL